jgi:hypothetical protein
MENKIITAKEAYDLAIGQRSEKVKELSEKASTDIWKVARQGYLHTYTTTGYYSKEVIATVANQFQELGYVVEVKPSAINFSWANVE